MDKKSLKMSKKTEKFDKSQKFILAKKLKTRKTENLKLN